MHGLEFIYRGCIYVHTYSVSQKPVNLLVKCILKNVVNLCFTYLIYKQKSYLQGTGVPEWEIKRAADSDSVYRFKPKRYDQYDRSTFRLTDCLAILCVCALHMVEIHLKTIVDVINYVKQSSPQNTTWHPKNEPRSNIGISCIKPCRHKGRANRAAAGGANV